MCASKNWMPHIAVAGRAAIDQIVAALPYGSLRKSFEASEAFAAITKT